MENPELERRLTVFQALIRGFLVRRHFSSLRGDYEEIVREIDGDLSHLEWHGNLIPVPGFSYEKGARPRSQDGPAAGPPGAEPGSGSRGNEPGPATEVLQPERDASGTREQQAPEDPAAPAPPVETCRAVGQHSEARAGPQADSTGRLAGWEDGRQSGSRTDATATRDSVALDAGSGVLRAGRRAGCAGLGAWASFGSVRSGPCPVPESRDRLQRREMPTTREGLRLRRNDLAMELLWLQQAIASRKKYLVLKQRLGTP
ncbi:IQ domain-containing protein C isoform X2 [Lepisosteus oculatus]|uniref:IQ domain-containing protein C isoform X2 n=1 Tax=Lepisosteus oculatus TaxID=7918 RepID=UPI0035F5051C